jgi:hypothetical protein
MTVFRVDGSDDIDDAPAKQESGVIIYRCCPPSCQPRCAFHLSPLCDFKPRKRSSSKSGRSLMRGVHCSSSTILLNLPLSLCLARNRHGSASALLECLLAHLTAVLDRNSRRSSSHVPKCQNAGSARCSALSPPCRARSLTLLHLQMFDLKLPLLRVSLLQHHLLAMCSQCPHLLRARACISRIAVPMFRAITLTMKTNIPPLQCPLVRVLSMRCSQS